MHIYILYIYSFFVAARCCAWLATSPCLPSGCDSQELPEASVCIGQGVQNGVRILKNRCAVIGFFGIWGRNVLKTPLKLSETNRWPCVKCITLEDDPFLLGGK